MTDPQSKDKRCPGCQKLWAQCRCGESPSSKDIRSECGPEPYGGKVGALPSKERFWVSQGYLYESYESHTPTVREATRSEKYLASEIERLTRELKATQQAADMGADEELNLASERDLLRAANAAFSAEIDRLRSALLDAGAADSPAVIPAKETGG